MPIDLFIFNIGAKTSILAFAYEGAALSDYTLVTDASGNFDSYVEIPGTAVVGTGKLVATFTGGANLQSGSAEKEITVNAPIVESSPTATYRLA